MDELNKIEVETPQLEELNESVEAEKNNDKSKRKKNDPREIIFVKKGCIEQRIRRCDLPLWKKKGYVKHE